MSNTETNEAIRVLSGKRLKLTVRLHLPDGKCVEWQAEERPDVKFNDADRCLWVYEGGYSGKPISRWIDGAVLLAEENPT